MTDPTGASHTEEAEWSSILSVAEGDVDNRHANLSVATDTNFVRDIIEDAPVAVEAQIPGGFSIQDESPYSPGLLRLTEQGSVPVAKDPVVVSGWVSNHSTGNKALELSWKGLGKWRRAVVERSKVLDKGKIVAALADRGFPVTSENARWVVRYISAYLDLNVRHIPVCHVSQQLGWQRDGGFLAGNMAIGSDVAFEPGDSGDSQIANSVSSKGHIDDWKNAVSVCAKFPRVELGLYASLAAPMLKVLEASSFAVDWAYTTSSGKTTTLRVAASVWGCPDERSGRSVIRSWGGTGIGIERVAGVMHSLPLILDDTKRARVVGGKPVTAQALYTIVNGCSDTRGSKSGLRQTDYWRTILLSTGEHRIVDDTKDGGTAARAISLWGPPFGSPSRETGQLIRDMNRGLLGNYGLAGPKFIEWVLSQESEWESWRDQHSEISAKIDAYLEDEGQPGVSGRISGYLATLELTGRLAHEALELPWEYESPVKRLATQLAQSSKEADRPTEALSLVMDWASTRRELFEGKRLETSREPDRWLGRWDFEMLAITSDDLRKVLLERGFEPRATVNIWLERGWLLTDKGRTQKTIRFGGEKAKMYCINLLRIPDGDMREPGEEG